MELQLQKTQINDLKRKEQEALRKEDDFNQKEKRLLEKIKEAEIKVSALRDTPPPSQESLRHYGSYQSNINPNPNQVTCFPERNFTSRNDYSRLPVTQEFPIEHNACLQVNQNSNQVVNGNIDFPPVRECDKRLRHYDASSMQSSSYPTASIAPVQQPSNMEQFEKDNPPSPSILLPLTG